MEEDSMKRKRVGKIFPFFSGASPEKATNDLR